MQQGRETHHVFMSIGASTHRLGNPAVVLDLLFPRDSQAGPVLVPVLRHTRRTTTNKEAKRERVGWCVNGKRNGIRYNAQQEQGGVRVCMRASCRADQRTPLTCRGPVGRVPPGANQLIVKQPIRSVTMRYYCTAERSAAVPHHPACKQRSTVLPLYIFAVGALC